MTSLRRGGPIVQRIHRTVPGEDPSWVDARTPGCRNTRDDGGAIGASVEWDFGDGTTAEGINVTHTYDPVPGEYIVVIILTWPDEVVFRSYEGIICSADEEGFYGCGLVGCSTIPECAEKE